MENEEGDFEFDEASVDPPPSAVNNLILDYYKKFGRNRDLEQFFSLSTAQSDMRDRTGAFWKKMKSQTDSSDSGEKKSESSTELCRISIKCSIPEPSGLESKYTREQKKSDSDSPPIITEVVAPGTTLASDEDSVKSYDVQSQKSNDATLDTSMNKPHSPTSSITSQRKLEWDSLADVGYANESDRKTSASSLSTLERLALKQQYSHNDSRQNIELEPPTSHSTPVEENESKSKGKKLLLKKTTKVYQKDVDLVELNLPHCSQTNLPQAISVNLSKHISFNVEKDGEINIDNIKRNISISPEKVTETERSKEKRDKEIQTSLESKKDNCTTMTNISTKVPISTQKFPVLVSLNTLKRRNKQKKLRTTRKKSRNKSKLKVNKKSVSREKATDQVSEAESFEYMPGHIYNANHMKINQSGKTNVGNKSSLESSVGLTTDSSKGLKHSFSKDLEKSIDLLKAVLQHNNDSTLKKKLIKEVVQRLIKSKYRDDESSTDFLSGLSFNSKRIGHNEGNHTTSSTSGSNNTAEKNKFTRPRKSILRIDKFNSNVLASTSQSAPNLPSIANIEKSTNSDLTEPIVFSMTDSDLSNKEKSSSDIKMTQTSSEKLYKKYLEALRREEAYKRHLKNKENFLKHKLVSSETALAQLEKADLKSQYNLRSLLKDLTQNKYDDGSGDARILKGQRDHEMNPYPFLNTQRSQSVYTLSSGHCDSQNKNSKLKNRVQSVIHGSSNTNHVRNEHHYCCCPFHTEHAKVAFTDSAVQVNIECENAVKKKKTEENSLGNIKCMRCNKESPRDISKIVSDPVTKDIKYVCVCSDEDKSSYKVPENFLIYKCSRLVDKTVQLGDTLTRNSDIEEHSNTNKNNACSCKHKDFQLKTRQGQCNCNVLDGHKNVNLGIIPLPQNSKSSQTNINSNQVLERKCSVKSVSSQSSDNTPLIKNGNMKCKGGTNICGTENNPKTFINEAVRSIQTEISINPRISDPSLSDINIVDNKECAKLISEQCKQILTSKTENNNEDSMSKKDLQVCCGSRSNNNVDIANLNKGVQSNLDPTDDNQNKNCTDQFTIPIQGTNMTVKVNLGTRGNAINSNNKTTKSQGIVTETMKVAEEFTSLRDDCTKGAQCNGATIFQQIDEDIKNNEQRRTPLNTNDCCAFNMLSKYNTYPKQDKCNIRKPLIRTNTDVTCIEGLDSIQIDLQKYKNVRENQQQSQNNNRKTSTDNQRRVVDQPIKSNCRSNLEQHSTASSVKSSKEDDAKKIEEWQCGKCKIPTSESCSQFEMNKDPLLDLIQDITKRYSKNDIEKGKRKKCFKEIVSLLNYLLNTEDSTDEQTKKSNEDSSASKEKSIANKETVETVCCPSKTLVDKGVQLSTKKSKSNKSPNTQSEKSEVPASTEFPTTSSDSATCKVLNKIKSECEKYHQKRCKTHNGLKACETSSSTSVNCAQCKRVHHCFCIRHKCRGHKAKATDKPKKKCVAYNLILQTSDSVLSEETSGCHNRIPLKNIIVKVPSKKKQVENVPLREMAAKFERQRQCPCSPNRSHRSRSLPNDSEISSTEEFLRNTQTYTVREYLERNRPDFVEKSSRRQDCLKVINETRPEMCPSRYYKMVVVHKPKCAANPCLEPVNMYCGGMPQSCTECVNPYMHVQNEVTRIGEMFGFGISYRLLAHERDAKRKLLSLQLDRQQTLSALTDQELRHIAKQLSEELRRKKVAPKFISEREMKMHSEKIYKRLPEVTRKKEELKKENIKKTNLLMANIFKKNLQKKTLCGALNLSNYSTVVKI